MPDRGRKTTHKKTAREKSGKRDHAAAGRSEKRGANEFAAFRKQGLYPTRADPLVVSAILSALLAESKLSNVDSALDHVKWAVHQYNQNRRIDSREDIVGKTRKRRRLSKLINEAKDLVEGRDPHAMEVIERLHVAQEMDLNGVQTFLKAISDACAQVDQDRSGKRGADLAIDLAAEQLIKAWDAVFDKPRAFKFTFKRGDHHGRIIAAAPGLRFLEAAFEAIDRAVPLSRIVTAAAKVSTTRTSKKNS